MRDTRFEELERLAKGVQKEVGRPLDSWAVAALLEAQGMRDVDAKERFGVPSLFSLAGEVYELARHGTVHEKKLPESSEAPANRFCRLVKHLWKGSFFAMPMLGQIACVLATEYSLWASLNFSELQATIVGLGTLGSFAVTGGLVMCVGRQGTVYKGLRAPSLLRKMCLRLMLVGAILVLALAGLAVSLQILTPLIGGGSFFVALGYYLLLSFLWLALALLYMLGAHQYSFLLTFGFGLLVAVLVRGVGVPVMVAQLVAIFLAAAGAFFVANNKMANMVPDEAPAMRGALLPPADVLVATLAPFFLYGFCYFALLFADRAMAWTAPGRSTPAAVWFHTPYELGMDWGLVSLLVPMTYLEHVVHELAPQIESAQKRFSCFELGMHRSAFLRFLGGALLTLVGLSIASVLFTYHGVLALRAFDEISTIRDFFASPVTFTIYWLSSISYQFLTLGLLISLLHFTLGQHELIVRRMKWALLISLSVGFLGSRILAPHWAVLGFISSTFVFALLMLHAGQRLARDVDFFYFSAF